MNTAHDADGCDLCSYSPLFVDLGGAQKLIIFFNTESSLANRWNRAGHNGVYIIYVYVEAYQLGSKPAWEEVEDVARKEKFGSSCFLPRLTQNKREWEIKKKAPQQQN